VCDKGPENLSGSVRITEVLVDLKEHYPNQVVLIAGNRDVNKLRFSSELYDPAQPSPLYWGKGRIPDIDSWMKNGHQAYPQAPPRCTLKEILDSDTKYGKLLQAAQKEPAHYERIVKLWWVLDCTMGSVGEFMRRWKELESYPDLRTHWVELGEKLREDVTPFEVFLDFYNSVQKNAVYLEGGVKKKKDGRMIRYLEGAQLAYLYNNDSLFVHGSANNVGRVPLSRKEIPNVKDWVVAINRWYYHQIFEAWRACPRWKTSVPPQDYYAGAARSREDEDFWSQRGGDRLLDYVLPDSQFTTVSAHMFDPKTFDWGALESYKGLQSRLPGIKRLFIGHQPHGQSPAIRKIDVQSELPPLLIVSGDTGLSGESNADDTRDEKAYTLIVLDAEHTRIYGQVPMLPEVPLVDFFAEDEPVGREDSENEGYIVKVKTLFDGNEYLISSKQFNPVKYESKKRITRSENHVINNEGHVQRILRRFQSLFNVGKFFFISLFGVLVALVLHNSFMGFMRLL